MIILLLAITVALGWAIVQTLLAEEVKGWLPVWSSRAIRLAVRRLPPEFRERYSEEWSAELAEFDERRLGGLCFSLGLLARASNLRRELPASSKRTRGGVRQRRAASAPGVGTATTPAQPATARSPRLSSWDHVASAGRSPELAEIDSPLDEVEARFAALLVEAPPRPNIAALEARLASPRAEFAALPRIEYTPYFSRPRERPVRKRRYGSGRRVDPEWVIAPLTRAERRIAANVSDSTSAAWDERARAAFTSAITQYDSGRRRHDRHSRLLMEGAVRLDVFLAAWERLPSSDPNDADQIGS